MFIKNNIKVIDKTIDKEYFYCKICSFPLVTIDDFRRMESFNCCEECFVKFAESRKEEWLEGFRPKKEEVNNYIKTKKQLYKNANN